MDVCTRIGSEIVPLVRARPNGGKNGSRGMATIYDVDSGLGNARMATEIGTNQITVPGPIIACVAGRVNTSITSTSPNIALKCGLLIGIKHFSACHKENDNVVVS